MIEFIPTLLVKIELFVLFPSIYCKEIMEGAPLCLYSRFILLRTVMHQLWLNNHMFGILLTSVCFSFCNDMKNLVIQ
jgi:hypothetical protein